MNKKAFTMIELIFVIIVMGILAAMAMPRMDRDRGQEAADNILSAIRYTQHLALLDNKQLYDDPQWQRRYWRIYFGTCNAGGLHYTIGSDGDMTGAALVAQNESAIDPSNGKLIWRSNLTCNANPQLSDSTLLGEKYDVTNIVPSGGCANQYIAFDHLGRPYGAGHANSAVPNNAGVITAADCNLTFSSTNNTFTPFSIIITRETGYAYIE